MFLGYGRVSKGEEQSDALQVQALKKAGCTRIFSEAASGGRWDRPELHHLLDQLRPDDVLVWKLDRLSRSLKDLRHSFASLLIQQGESLAYVKEQMGHHSIQVTVDIYGHLVPGGNKAAVDRLDGPAPHSPYSSTAEEV